jgi:predicted permease
MGGWWQDVRFAGRMFRKRPGATALAVVALALGIGLTTTMFSIVQGVILRGLPFEDADRIQYLTLVSPSNPRGRVNAHDFMDWRSQQQSFESMEGYVTTTLTVTSPSGYPERVPSARLTPGVLRALRAAPAMGRDFTDADVLAGAPPVIILGHTVWESQFQSSRQAIGQVVHVNGVPTTVVGVMPPKFGFPQSAFAWVPLAVTLEPKRGTGMFFNVIGRLKSGTSIESARAEIVGISAQLATVHPENKDLRGIVEPFVRQTIGSEVVATLLTMLGAVFGVMVIACVNVTNLQLARAAERTKEVAIRVAIGAGRWRIVRQTLVEGLVLSTVGALAGVALAWAGTEIFSRAIVDTNPPFWIDVRLDPVVLLFVTAIAVTAALVSSLVPGWRLARTDVNGALKDEGRGTTSLRMGRFTRWLVVVEVTVSCVLLVVSGLMIRSIVVTSRFDVPFATEDVFLGGIMLDERNFPTPADLARSHMDIEEKLSLVPGIRAVALATGYPRVGGGSIVDIEGRTFDGPEAYPRAQSVVGSTRYFDVLRVKPLLGRVFDRTDAEAGLPVVVVDETFARVHLPEGPIGRRIRFGQQRTEGLSFESSPWLTVVGVVPALVETSRTDQVSTLVFRPLTQAPTRSLRVFAVTAGDPLAVTSGVRTTLADIGGGTPLTNPTTLAAAIWQEGWPVRVFGGLFMAFGFAALVLASAGLYGVMAFGVQQRTQEIGVRMAMGAGRGRVLRMILWQGVWRVGLAVAVGLVPGWQLGKALGEIIRGVSPSDPLVLSITALTLLASGAVASLVPALRAASVDPIVALRGD